jgi:dihydrofolate reductase
MRKLVAVLDVSLDGVVEAPERWQVWAAAASLVRATSDTVLVGRRTFEAMAAGMVRLGGIRTLVVSSTLAHADAVENSEVIKGEQPLRTLAALKEVPGQDLAVIGSMTLVQSLLQAGLVDELHLMMHPVVAGQGARLFDGGQPRTFELSSVSALRSGVLHSVYTAS